MLTVHGECLLLWHAWCSDVTSYSACVFFNGAYIIRAIASNLQCRWRWTLQRHRDFTLKNSLLFLKNTTQNMLVNCNSHMQYTQLMFRLQKYSKQWLRAEYDDCSIGHWYYPLNCVYELVWTEWLMIHWGEPVFNVYSAWMIYPCLRYQSYDVELEVQVAVAVAKGLRPFFAKISPFSRKHVPEIC